MFSHCLPSSSSRFQRIILSLFRSLWIGTVGACVLGHVRDSLVVFVLGFVALEAMLSFSGPSGGLGCIATAFCSFRDFQYMTAISTIRARIDYIHYFTTLLATGNGASRLLRGQVYTACTPPALYIYLEGTASNDTQFGPKSIHAFLQADFMYFWESGNILACLMIRPWIFNVNGKGKFFSIAWTILVCFISDDHVYLFDLAPPQVHDIFRHLTGQDGFHFNLVAISVQAQFTVAQPHRTALLLPWPWHRLHHLRVT